MVNTLLALISYLIGICFAVFVGHLMIGWFNATIHAGKSENLPHWSGNLAETLDRLIFAGSILFGFKEFIVVWLVFRIAAQWKRWDGMGEAGLNLFVINNGLSLMYGVVGGVMAAWLVAVNYLQAAILASGLVVLNLLFIQYAEQFVPGLKAGKSLAENI